MFSPISAQSISISVRDQREPLPGATVSLINNSDTTQVRYTTTDASGNATFNNVSDGYWRIRISYIGFITQERTVLNDPMHRNFIFTLKSSAVSLNGVTITADRPFIRQEDDKMIIDPTPLIGISSNTLEVLESTPGLYVDYDAGIFLSSTTPAAVYVNGREQKLSTPDIMNLLRNLPPGSIERIEVLRTPSTKYDAASSGGIVNVVLKKGVKLGRFGSLSTGMNQGKYGNRFFEASFNNSGEKTNYYINTNYNHSDRLEEMNSIRYLNSDTSLNQQSESRRIENQVFLGYGLVYEAGKKTDLSYDGRIGYTHRKTDAVSNSITENGYYLPILESEDLTNSNNSSWNISQDLGLTKKLDTVGSEWVNIMSYNISTWNNLQQFSSGYTLPFDTTINGEGESDLQRQFLLLQSDLTYGLPFKIKLETGIKGTWQDFKSTTDFFDLSSGNSIQDSSRSNSFRYSEGIFAAYAQASKTIWGGLILKSGCRLEYTYMDGKQLFPSDTSFEVNRADFFPYVYLSRPLPTIMGISLTTYMIYRRTISRPNYEDLNPVIDYIDPFLYRTGNPELKPQFTNNIEFNVSYDDMPVFAIGINRTTDIFSEVVYTDAAHPDVAVMTSDNLGSSTEKYLRGLIGIPPGGTYFFALGAQFNSNEYNGFYEGNPLSYQYESWRFFTFHSLKLSKQTKLNVYGFMMVNGQRGFYELDNFGSLNLGLSHTMMNQKLNITLNARDIFRTMVIGYSINQSRINSLGDRYTDNRRFGFNIRYNFGVGKKEHSNGFGVPDDAM